MALNPTRISELTQADPQPTDQIPMARGSGTSGRTYKTIVSDLFNKIFKTTNSPTVSLYFDPLTLTLSADANANGILGVGNTPTIKLNYDTTTRRLSAELQKPLDLSSWSNTNAARLTLPTYVETPPGAIMPFAGSVAPDGWLLCDGNESEGFQPLPDGTGTFQGKTANFSRLYTVLGNTYGADGKLPDLRGYFIRGFGTNADGTASGPSRGQKQSDSFQGHKHDIYDPTHAHGITDNGHTHTGTANASVDSQHTHGYKDNSSAQDPGGGGGSGFSADVQGDFQRTTDPGGGAHSHTVTLTTNETGIIVNPQSTGVKVLSPTGDQATAGSGDSNGPGGSTPRVSNETRPKNVSLLYCIKY